MRLHADIRLFMQKVRAREREKERETRDGPTETRLSVGEVTVIDYRRTERGRRIVQPLGEIERSSPLESG